MNQESREDRWARKAYRAALRLYPQAFRLRYGLELEQAFEAEWRRAAREGLAARGALAFRLLGDLGSSLALQWAKAGSLAFVLGTLAVAAGIWGVGALHADEWIQALCWGLLCGWFALGVQLKSAGRPFWVRFAYAGLGFPMAALLAPVLKLGGPTPPPEPVIAAGPLPSGPDGAAIMDRMRQRYRTASTYRDTGEVWTVFPAHYFRRLPFSTAYRKGGAFRFEFREQYQPLQPWNRYVVWSDGREVRRWWSAETRVEDEASVERALGGAAGVSNLASVMVPGLLMPQVRGGWYKAVRPVLLGQSQIGGRSAYVLEVPRGSRDCRVWVDKGSYALLRIEFGTPFALGTVRQTICYQPILNGSLPLSALDFAPGKPTPAIAGFWTGQSALMGLLVGATLALVLLRAGFGWLAGRGFRLRRIGGGSWVELFCMACVGAGLFARGLSSGWVLPYVLIGYFGHVFACAVYATWREPACLT